MEKVRQLFEDVSTFFEGEEVFSPISPFRILKKEYPRDETIRLHYSESIEILICQQASGFILIEGQSFDCSSHEVIVIPPGILHTSHIKKGPGIVTVFQLSLAALQSVLNVNAAFNQEGIDIRELSFVHPEYDRLKVFINELEAETDKNPFNRLGILCQIFEIILKHSHETQAGSSKFTDTIRPLIQWTEQNLSERVLLEDAATILGLSRNYFCRYFREQTGQTYFEYLTHLRLEKARTLLVEQRSVTDAAYESGFENVSYFIRSFRKLFGITPLRFKKSLFMSSHSELITGN